MRYLVKKKGRTFDYIPIPKNATLIKVKNGFKGKVGKKIGVLHRGYKLTRAKSESSLFKRFMRRR